MCGCILAAFRARSLACIVLITLPCGGKMFMSLFNKSIIGFSRQVNNALDLCSSYAGD